jgi:hypothetical protein
MKEPSQAYTEQNRGGQSDGTLYLHSLKAVRTIAGSNSLNQFAMMRKTPCIQRHNEAIANVFVCDSDRTG